VSLHPKYAISRNDRMARLVHVGLAFAKGNCHPLLPRAVGDPRSDPPGRPDAGWRPRCTAYLALSPGGPVINSPTLPGPMAAHPRYRPTTPCPTASLRRRLGPDCSVSASPVTGSGHTRALMMAGNGWHHVHRGTVWPGESVLISWRKQKPTSPFSASIQDHEFCFRYWRKHKQWLGSAPCGQTRAAPSRSQPAGSSHAVADEKRAPDDPSWWPAGGKPGRHELGSLRLSASPNWVPCTERLPCVCLWQRKRLACSPPCGGGTLPEEHAQLNLLDN